LLANRAWVQDKLELKPNFFEGLTAGQKPEFLWIGCSDSRVPAEEITGAQPGEIFVHRNIANLFIRSDFSAMSVLQYAVEALEIRHIIVCGHQGCGGVRAALTNQDFGALNKWLFYLKENYNQHAKEFDKLPLEERIDRMVEINVKDQVMNLAKTALIQRSWRKRKAPLLHGWVFGLKDGFLRDVINVGPDVKLDPIFKFE